jgi:RimJ/RimL family protein N-acetyltransferase
MSESADAAHATNQYGQPIGLPLPNWRAPQAPVRKTLTGRWCTVEPLDPDRHAHALYAANSLDEDGRHWTYLLSEPFSSQAEYTQWLHDVSLTDDPQFYTFCDANTGGPIGLGSYLRITPAAGSIEVGHLRFSNLMQRTPAATEAMYLMMKNAFAMGYRRYEWKCDAFNAPSRRAATRYGFTFEGIFRQATIYKNRNRDTAWFSMLDNEWPALEDAFEQWLAPENFDTDGKQRRRLETIREAQ